jgi:hypothetical protein
MAIDTVTTSRRGNLILVPVSDVRLAPVYQENSGGICGEVDGPMYFAIGRSVTNEQLHSFAAKEEIADVAALIAFRDSLPLATH